MRVSSHGKTKTSKSILNREKNFLTKVLEVRKMSLKNKRSQ
jgi:hypothetical protein